MRALPSEGMCQKMCHGCHLPAVRSLHLQQRLGVLHAADMDLSRCIVSAVCSRSLQGMVINMSMIAAACLWRAKHCQHPERPEIPLNGYSKPSL